jgi:hypothetical protein
MHNGSLPVGPTVDTKYWHITLRARTVRYIRGVGILTGLSVCSHTVRSPV